MTATNVPSTLRRGPEVGKRTAMMNYAAWFMEAGLEKPIPHPPYGVPTTWLLAART